MITGRPYILALTLLTFLACSTPGVEPPPPPAPSPPPLVKVPHPDGFDIADVRLIFKDPMAPAPESLRECMQDFQKLKASTQSIEEQNEGVRELVRQDPVYYHWCFYRRIVDLDDKLKSDNYVDERQKDVLSAFDFMVPVARAFMTDFHDSRYLRMGIQHYRRLSAWIFYRKLDLSPEMTSQLVETANPFGLWRPPASQNSVLEKYDLTKPDRAPASVEAGVTPVASAMPAPVASAVPAIEPVSGPVPNPSPALPPLPPSPVTPEPSRTDRKAASDSGLIETPPGPSAGPSQP